MATKRETLPPIRLTKQEDRVIRAGAKRAGLTLSAYVVSTCVYRSYDLGVKLTSPQHPKQMALL